MFRLLGTHFIKDSCKLFLLLKASFLFLLQIRVFSFLLLLQISLVLSKFQVFSSTNANSPTSLTILHVFKTSSFSELTDISSKIWDIYERHLASQISSFLDDIVASIHKECGRREGRYPLLFSRDCPPRIRLRQGRDCSEYLPRLYISAEISRVPH